MFIRWHKLTDLGDDPELRVHVRGRVFLHSQDVQAEGCLRRVDALNRVG